MSSELTDFESNLMRLLIVSLRFQAIHHEFPNQMKEGTDALLVRSLFRDSAIQQLHNFLKIREDLLNEPEFKKLDDIIKKLIQPILNHEEGITKMRHNYVAHIQERGRNFRVMMNDIVQEYNLPTDWASWNYFTGLAWFYYGLVDHNFKREMDRANAKYDARVGVPITNTSGFAMTDVKAKINEILTPLFLELDEEGFKTTLTDEQLADFKKKYSA